MHQKVQQLVNVPVALSMRYGTMTILKGLQELQDKGVTEVMLFPLYPQHAMASTTTIVVKPIITTTYTVTITDVNGCTASDQVTVTVRVAKCDESDVYIPNAFSPNGDGNNDILLVRSNFIDQLELMIYNRWGQQVFRSTSKDVGWDGSYKGQELPPDAYAFYMKVLCVNGNEYKKQGNINLLR